jgi:hypothetical protein
MFPYARDNLRKHLTSTFDSEETKEDIKLLHIQVSNEVFPIIEASNGIFFLEYAGELLFFGLHYEHQN